MHGLRSAKTISTVAAAGLIAMSISLTANAAGEHAGGHGGAAVIGKPGDPAQASRTIDIVMTDNAFAPDRISVGKGETVRFAVRNAGEIVHEFTIGTTAMHAAHQKEMMSMFERGVLEVDRIHRDRMKAGMGHGGAMSHDDPNSVLLEPGESTTLTWRFDTDAELEFACNVPGHYEAGMVGRFSVER